MQITSNSTGMAAGLTLVADEDARDCCVVVIKGTFAASPDGSLALADEQQPLIATDEHYGDPERSAVRLECDFALRKPYVDVLVVGSAVAPDRRPVRRLRVRLELPGGRAKDIEVVGERRWVRTLATLIPSEPVPFTEMPLRFDRAFGGSDDSRGPTQVACEERNLVGVGFHPQRSLAAIEGTALANLEHPSHPVTSIRDRPPPIGLGVVGRTWLPRRSYAGTYDQAWLDHRAPYLPVDFDVRYHQCAPADQQLPALAGGELIRCVHMAAQPLVQYRVPNPRIPVCFRAVAGDHQREAQLDTIVLEPQLGRAQLVWRCAIPVGKRPSDLRAILIGEQPATIVGSRGGKPAFRKLDDAVRALRARRGKAGAA